MSAQVTETFAFIDLGSGDRGLADCIAGLNNTKWKGKVVRIDNLSKRFMKASFTLGGKYLRFEPFSFTIIDRSVCQMKLQQAKESFMERLARERRERESGGWTLLKINKLLSEHILKKKHTSGPVGLCLVFQYTYVNVSF